VDALGPSMTIRHPDMREELKDALRGLADDRWAQRKAADPALEPPDFFLDVSNALHAIEDVARPAGEYVGTSLADTDEAALITAVFDAWEAVAADVGPRAPDAVIYASPAWPGVIAASRAALARLDEHDAT
jgi:hypothetical protein